MLYANIFDTCFSSPSLSGSGPAGENKHDISVNSTANNYSYSFEKTKTLRDILASLRIKLGRESNRNNTQPLLWSQKGILCTIYKETLFFSPSDWGKKKVTQCLPRENLLEKSSSLSKEFAFRSSASSELFPSLQSKK